MKSILENTLALVVLTVCLKFSTNTNLNSSSICEIIEKLKNFYKIETLPIFRENFFEDDFSNSTDLFKQLWDKILIPQMHFVEFSGDEQLRFVTNEEQSLSIIITRPGSSEILKMVESKLNYMHISKILIVLSQAVVLRDLKYLLNWFEHEKFFVVLVLFEDRKTKQIRIFGIDPYPTIKWVNRTHLIDSGQQLFVPRTNDFKEYRIETPFMEDVPRVFFYVQNGKRHLVGRNANIIVLFAKHMNIKLVKTFQPKSDLKMVLKQLPHKKSELSLHSYSIFYLEAFGWSYPLDMVYFCVIVPVHRAVPKNVYFVSAFDFGTWLAAAFSVIFIAVLMRYIDPRKTTNEDDAGMRYFFRSLTLMMYSANISGRMYPPTIRQFVFYAQVFLLAFILSCFYSTYLTSFCTEMVFRPPIETVEDLVRANLRIMIIDYELETAQKYSHFGDKFLQLLYPVPYFEVIKRRENFDHNFAYTIQQDRWFYLHKQQRGLSHPMFRLSNICFGPHYLVFPLLENSYLTSYLFGFFLRVQQAGLDYYWEEEAFRLAVAMNHSRVLVDRTVFVRPLDLEYFQYVFAGWFVGLGISMVSFIDEFVRKKNTTSRV